MVITDHGKALTRGKDYTVEYQNNTSIGRARAGITGIGNYSGYFTISFFISIGEASATATLPFLILPSLMMVQKKSPWLLLNATATP